MSSTPSVRTVKRGVGALVALLMMCTHSLLLS
jgi:hypothetical protein